MDGGTRFLLIGVVVAVGVLHTIVPDHWLPIALLARQQGWSRRKTGWAAARAGFGHVVSALPIGLAVWLGGAALAERFGAMVDLVSSAALVAFGRWIALAALRELRGERGHSRAQTHDGSGQPHPAAVHYRPAAYFGAALAVAGPAPTGHIHLHRHGGGLPHAHWHEHAPDRSHEVAADIERDPPLHEHSHESSARRRWSRASRPFLRGNICRAVRRLGGGTTARAAGSDRALRRGAERRGDRRGRPCFRHRAGDVSGPRLCLGARN